MDSADKTTIDYRRLRTANLPEAPSANGDYVPVLTVSGTGDTVTWDAAPDIPDTPDIPEPPTVDDEYVLTATVSEGVAVLTWESTT